MTAESFEQHKSRELQNAAPGEGLSFRQIMESIPNFGDLTNRTDNCATKNLPNLTIEKCVSNEMINQDNSLSSSRDFGNRDKPNLNSDQSQVKPEKPFKPVQPIGELDLPEKNPLKPVPKPGLGGIKDCLPEKPQKDPHKPINSLDGKPIEAKPYLPKK